MRILTVEIFASVRATKRERERKWKRTKTRARVAIKTCKWRSLNFHLFSAQSLLFSVNIEPSKCTHNTTSTFSIGYAKICMPYRSNCITRVCTVHTESLCEYNQHKYNAYMLLTAAGDVRDAVQESRYYLIRLSIVFRTSCQKQTSDMVYMNGEVNISVFTARCLLTLSVI